MTLSPDTKKKSRAGWAEAFEKMAKAGTEKLLDPAIFEISSDKNDWKW